MNFRQLRIGRHWAISAIAGDRDDDRSPGLKQCELIDFVRGLKGQLEVSKAKFWYLLSQCVDDQRHPAEVLGSDLVHPAYKTDVDGRPITIWEFCAIDIRVLFFIEDGNVILCTHGFVKKTRRTPRKEQEHAVAVYTEYRKLRKQK